MPKKSLKQKAFTLAETLITLSIIGVVAAMTVPTLMSNANKQIYVTGLKKAYSTLQNAIKMVPISVGCPADDYQCAGVDMRYKEDEDAELFKLLSNQLKWEYVPIQKIYNDYGYTYGRVFEKSNTQYIYRTGDGMFFMSYGASDFVEIDVNGEKGPNKPGRDIFEFNIALTNKKNISAGTLLPCGSKLLLEYQNGSGYRWETSCTKDKITSACTARVLETGKMDY